MSRLEVVQVSRRFIVENRTHTVLDRVDLRVDQGELVCLLGRSGCGKTTLLRIIATLDREYEGAVLVDGVRATRPGPDRMMLFQETEQVFPWLTVLQNVSMPLEVQSHRDPSGEARRFAGLVGLGDALNFYPHQLSGGMRQRVALARALAVQPAVLLMDEPFAGVDAATRSDLQQLLLGIHTERAPTILFVTHQIDEALILADRIVVLGDNGSVAASIPRDRVPQTTERRSADPATVGRQSSSPDELLTATLHRLLLPSGSRR